MSGFLHLLAFVLVMVAIRLIYVWRQPFRDDGKRRIGGRWTARVHQTVTDMIRERLGR